MTPVYKRGSHSLPVNYRPISVLSVLSSSFERAILPQLRGRLLRFIPPEQFGFVPGAGVPDAGVLLADEIASALEDREELRIVSLDLRGVFDRIWWRGLLAHLWNIGLCGRTYDLFSHYLSSCFLLLLLMEFYLLNVLFALVFPRAVFGLHFFLICTLGNFPA